MISFFVFLVYLLTCSFGKWRSFFGWPFFKYYIMASKHKNKYPKHGLVAPQQWFSSGTKVGSTQATIKPNEWLKSASAKYITFCWCLNESICISRGVHPSKLPIQNSYEKPTNTMEGPSSSDLGKC